MKVWFIGIKGAVATTTIVGVLAIKQDLNTTAGIPSEDEQFSRLNLAPIEDVQFGGHDIRSISLYEAAWQNVRENNTFDTTELAKLRQEIESIPVRCGIVNNCGQAITGLCDNKSQTLSEAAHQISDELRQFARNDDCVVVNLASTEPYFATQPEHATLEKFENAIEANSNKIPASAIYAYSALKNGMPYVNFTPSLGNDIPALKELAIDQGVPHCGKDGKTGETLVKTALVPMFKYRRLKIDGWYGSNILGNLDGQILQHPDNKQSKLVTKTGVVPKMLGYEPHVSSRIDYFPPLSDHKIAWDFVSFKGFLDHRMNMQFTWQGCDSILAAPLVIDLFRFMELAKRRGMSGLVEKLAIYFKDPLGTNTLDLCSQYALFNQWIEQM